MNVARRIERIEPSATLSTSVLAADIEAQGADVVDLSVGDPDFPTPERIIEAGKEAMDAGHTGYADTNGVPALREAIATKLRGDGLGYTPDEIIVTPGGKQALYETIQTLIDDGDDVCLLDPAWVSYEPMVKLAGGNLSRIDLSEHDFQLEPALDELSDAVSATTNLLIVNSPSNPSGEVYSDAALKGVRDLAVEHDITVISDEIYKEITYGITPTSLGSFDGMAERTVTINGFSKAYAMTGWRLGYLAAPKPLIDQTSKLQSHSVTCAPNFIQHAGIEALETTDSAVEEMVDAFEERRDLLVNLLAQHNVDVAPPDGAFYMMVPVDRDDQAWCETAIEEAYVATVPGSAFGTPGYALFSYANSQERLREAVDRLAANDFF